MSSGTGKKARKQTPEKPKRFRVVWEIDIWATSPRKAAQEALDTMRDPGSEAVYFEVWRDDSHWSVDLLYDEVKLLDKGTK
jgi:hypothetical protein